MEKRIDGVKCFGGIGRPRNGLETERRVSRVTVCRKVLEIAPLFKLADALLEMLSEVSDNAEIPLGMVSKVSDDMETPL
jgi:hypothetical protein